MQRTFGFDEEGPSDLMTHVEAASAHSFPILCTLWNRDAARVCERPRVAGPRAQTCRGSAKWAARQRHSRSCGRGRAAPAGACRRGLPTPA